MIVFISQIGIPVTTRNASIIYFASYLSMSNAFTQKSPTRGSSPYDSDSSDDDEIVVNTSSLRSNENLNPNKSRLREKWRNARKDRLVRANSASESVDSPLADMTETQCEPEDMLLTQHGGVEEKQSKEEEDNAEGFDESAFLPTDVVFEPEVVAVETVETVEPTPQSTNLVTAEPLAPPAAPLANDYSSSEDQPVYSEAEFQLAVEAKLSKAIKEAKAEAEAEAEKAVKAAKAETEKAVNLAKVEMDKQMEDVLVLQEQEFEEKTTELKATIAAKDKEIQSVRAEQDAVLEEMLVKLDLFEKDTAVKIKAKDDELSEVKEALLMKEKVLSAVNTQLADHHNNLKELMGKNSELEEKNVELESSLKTIEEALKESEVENEKLEKTHADEVAVLKEKRVKAVEKMQEEMTKAAESQFAEANKHFFKLKSEFTAKSEEVR